LKRKVLLQESLLTIDSGCPVSWTKLPSCFQSTFFVSLDKLFENIKRCD